MSTNHSRIVSRALAVAVAATFGGATAAAVPGAPLKDAGHVHHSVMQQPVPASPMSGHDTGVMHDASQPAGDRDHQAMPHTEHQQGHVGHEHHAEMLKQEGYLRTEVAYQVPDVTLINQDGERVSLRALLAGPEPVLLNYIYTSCTTICPVLSASFAQTQKELGPDGLSVRMVSISIDPEHDTPEKLRDYAQRFRAAAGWQLLTGSLEDVVTVQKAFDAFRGDKMNHIPLTFLRVGTGDRWIRMQGFASAAELVREYRGLASAGSPHRHGAS